MLHFLHKKTITCSFIVLLAVVLFFGAAALDGSSLMAADISSYLDGTYRYAKGGESAVLTEAEAKEALTEKVDLLIIASGRDAGHTAVTDDEFSTYLGYVNYNLRNGNGSYAAVDFLRGAVAVSMAGGDPTAVGKDNNGNYIDLLYKGLYSRKLSTLEAEGTKTVAYALLALNTNNISPSTVRAVGSKVSVAELKSSLVCSATSMASSSAPDVSLSALVIEALSPYYDSNSSVRTAVDALFARIATLQNSDGLVKGSAIATAGVITALCSCNIDPAQNDFFAKDPVNALLSVYNSDGGFRGGSGSSASSVDAANYGRCALVAYRCYQENNFFYDKSSVKKHSVKVIAGNTPKENSSNKKNNTGKQNSTTTKKSSSGSNAKVVSPKSNSKSAEVKKSIGSSASSSASTSSPSSSSSSDQAAGTPATSSAANVTTVTAADGTTIPKSAFEGIKGTPDKYVYEGTWGESESYTLSFTGSNVVNPMDFNALISSSPEHQIEIDAAAGEAEYIHFDHDGYFPGKASATVTVSLPDGMYKCYHYSTEEGRFTFVQDVNVAGGMVSFDLNTGGDYFITTQDVGEEDIRMTVDDTIDGVVPSSVFEGIEGKSTRLILSGTTDSDVEYDIIFEGTEVTDPIAFDMRLTSKSENLEAIQAIASDPLLLHFEHQGNMPGTATVMVYSELDPAKNYSLYYFNDATKSSEYAGPVTVDGGHFSFVLSHCSDYFVTEDFDNALATQSASAGSGWLLWVILIVLFLLLVGAVVVYRVMGKEKFVAFISGFFRKKDRNKDIVNDLPEDAESVGSVEAEEKPEEEYGFIPEEIPQETPEESPEGEKIGSFLSYTVVSEEPKTPSEIPEAEESADEQSPEAIVADIMRSFEPAVSEEPKTPPEIPETEESADEQTPEDIVADIMRSLEEKPAEITETGADEAPSAIDYESFKRPTE